VSATDTPRQTARRGVRGRLPADVVDRTTLIVVALIAVPLIVALVRVSGTTWFPTGDMAQAELHMRGFPAHPPLVGAAGRIGSFLVPYGQGSHPGPAMWVALLPVYVLFGRSAFGLMVSVTVVQFAFICLTVWMARRVAGATAGLAAAVLLAMVARSLGTDVFLEPWNPWLALFAFSAFVCACWGIVVGHRSWWWLAVGTGSFALQCHVGYLALVGTALAFVALVDLRRFVTGRRDAAPTAAYDDEKVAIRRLRRYPFVVGVVVAVAMWLPPVLDQWRRRPGNLRILYTHFTSSADDDGSARSYVGFGGALRAMFGELAIPGSWLTGSQRQPTEPVPVAAAFVAVVAIGLGMWWLWRHRTQPEGRQLLALYSVVGVLTFAGLASTARVFGEFYDYVIRWWWIIVLAALLPSVAAALHAVAQRSTARVAAASAVAVAAVSCAFALVQSADASRPAPQDSDVVAGIIPIVLPQLDRSFDYLVRWYDPASLGGVPYGVILELERQGFDVGVDAPASAGALPHRVRFETDASAVLWVVTGQRAIDDFRARPDASELGVFDARSVSEQQRSTTLRADIEAGLRDAGLDCLIPVLDTQYGLVPFTIGASAVPQGIRRLAGEYDSLGLPIGVFEVPSGAAGYAIESPPC
jgi:hypothetical protein